MASSVYVGLVVNASERATALNTSTFGSVSVYGECESPADV
jgi:hypothetical protein